MKLIIGLGNPGFRYKKTRHNAGFLAVDYIQKNIGGFSKWKLNEKLQAEISENLGQGIILVKPQTYMNSSGTAVKKLIENYKLIIENCTVVHDDFDLPIGTFKCEKGKNSGGHKGVQSIIDSLGTNDFGRLRMGIRPLNAPENIKAENFVVKKFTREERKIIEQTIPTAINELFKNFEN